MMKQKVIAMMLAAALMVPMAGASAKSWDCESGTCVETDKPCGQFTTECTDGTCGDDTCATCDNSGWIGKLLAALAAIGITSLIVSEMAAE